MKSQNRVVLPGSSRVLSLTTDQFRELFRRVDAFKSGKGRADLKGFARECKIHRRTLYSYLKNREAIEEEIASMEADSPAKGAA
ncbi:MAG TPA: hypothetical protein PKA27_06965 [Fimbriimonadaceae bacterium]|nr:hypothetical protein [Fimbriimonadaceae bacterium]